MLLPFSSSGNSASITNKVSKSGDTMTGALAIQVANANSLAVGRQGATNPVLQIDSSTASQVTGIKIKGAASGGGVAISVISSSSNENLTIDALGSGTITFGSVSTGNIISTRLHSFSAGATIVSGQTLTLTGATIVGTPTWSSSQAITLSTVAQPNITSVGTLTSLATSGAITISSASANSLAVGLNGATNPAFNVDSSTASQAAGLNVKGAVTGGTVAISAIDSGSNTGITIDGKGTGTIGINTLSTTSGLVTIGNSTSLAGVAINGPITSAAHTITSTSANSLAVGRQGATSPVLQIDASVASVATGISIQGKAAGSGVTLSAISSGINEQLTITPKGNANILLQPAGGAILLQPTSGNDSTGFIVVKNASNGTVLSVDSGNSKFMIKSSNGGAFSIGSAGFGTNPAFNVDSSAGSQAAGLSVVGAATGGTVNVVCIDSGSNTNLTINGKGTGTIGINTSSTTSGLVTIGNSTSLAGVAINGPQTITGKITNYNSVNTVGWGIPSIYGSGRSTAQTAAVSSVATYTVGATDGSFIVSANVNVTTSTTHSFTVQVTYTDETNTAQTLTLSVMQLAGTIITSITNVTGTGPYEGIPVHIRAKASTAITVKTSGTFTSVTYNVEGMITQIA